MSAHYGGYMGGDPRKFHPDVEACTAEELLAWKAHCDAWTSGFRIEPDQRLQNPFGLGVTDIDDDEDDDWNDDDDERDDDRDDDPDGDRPPAPSGLARTPLRALAMAAC